VRNRTGKYLLKKLAERYFPSSFVHRPKKGFGIPLAHWMRGPLRTTVEAILRDPHATAPLDGRVIEKSLTDFYERKTDNASKLWAVLFFALWNQRGRLQA
jgi:asparagine synthase (glutamine-hydrolysing)